MKIIDPNWAQNLAKKYAPIVYLHSQDKYKPSSVSWFVNKCHLVNQETTALKEVTIKDLQCHNHEHTHLFLADESGRYGCIATAEVYVHLRKAPNRINEKNNLYDLQYWFFFPYNGGVYLNDKKGFHEGDWEHVTVRLYNIFENPMVHKVFYSAHGKGKWLVPQVDYKPKRSVATLKNNCRPIVFAAHHSHAFYETDDIFPRLVVLKDKTDYGELWDIQNQLEIISDDLTAKYYEWNLQNCHCTKEELPEDHATSPKVSERHLPWLGFKGRWGRKKNSPTGPLQKGTWEDI